MVKYSSSGLISVSKSNWYDSATYTILQDEIHTFQANRRRFFFTWLGKNAILLWGLDRKKLGIENGNV